MAKKGKEGKSGVSSSGGGSRPPIVAVLGHVDHGKTSILDYIRQTQVAAKEAGGITQSIGAYQVEFKGKRITFIDTPGHKAFAKMRERGGVVSDLVVLVVAADDGVMPQTQESLEHIKAAKVPFLVAVNKIDLPQADVEKVYSQLEKVGVFVEGRGGKIVAVPCSAKEGTGIDDLLEMILLLGEMLELKADPEGPFEAVIIESRATKAGPQATVLVKNGTLKVGDQILAEESFAKVRALIDEKGKNVILVSPGTPVSVLGFAQVPPVGAKVKRVEALPSQEKTLPKPPVFLPAAQPGQFKMILKADSLGSLEAIRAGLPEEVYVVKEEVGDITESDISLAESAEAEIFGFKVKASPPLQKLAEEEKIKVRIYQIIYKLFEELEEVILSAGEKEEAVTSGKAEIIAEFPYGEGRIAGCRVVEGRIAKNDRLTLVRQGEVLGRVRLSSMKHQEEDIKVAEKDSQFGVIFKGKVDFQIGDMLISDKR